MHLQLWHSAEQGFLWFVDLFFLKRWSKDFSLLFSRINNQHCRISEVSSITQLSEALVVQPYVLSYGRQTERCMRVSQMKDWESSWSIYLFTVRWMTKWRHCLLRSKSLMTNSSKKGLKDWEDWWIFEYIWEATNNNSKSINGLPFKVLVDVRLHCI